MCQTIHPWPSGGNQAALGQPGTKSDLRSRKQKIKAANETRKEKKKEKKDGQTNNMQDHLSGQSKAESELLSKIRLPPAPGNIQIRLRISTPRYLILAVLALTWSQAVAESSWYLPCDPKAVELVIFGSHFLSLLHKHSFTIQIFVLATTG